MKWNSKNNIRIKKAGKGMRSDETDRKQTARSQT